jgi:hypothetical protein
MNDPLLHLATEAARCLRIAEDERQRLQTKLAWFEAMGVPQMQDRIEELKAEAIKGRGAIDQLMAECDRLRAEERRLRREMSGL